MTTRGAVAADFAKIAGFVDRGVSIAAQRKQEMIGM